MQLIHVRGNRSMRFRMLKETQINLPRTKNVSVNGVEILMYSWREGASINGHARRLGG